jgi:hypothetical protein
VEGLQGLMARCGLQASYYGTCRGRVNCTFGPVLICIPRTTARSFVCSQDEVSAWLNNYKVRGGRAWRGNREDGVYG